MGIASPGGGIGIHGTEERQAALARIWIRLAHATSAARVWGPTEGCIALTNEDVDALFDAVPGRHEGHYLRVAVKGPNECGACLW